LGSSRFWSSVLVLVTIAVFAVADEARWVESEGIYQGSELEGRKNICEKALHEAERLAIEQVSGIYIESHTIVANSKILRDIIGALSRGKIKDRKGLSEDFDGKTLVCKVKGKFLVEPRRVNLPDFKLSVKLPKSRFTAGEELKIFLESGSACYPYLFSVDAQGNVYRIFPLLKNDASSVRGPQAREKLERALSGLEGDYRPLDGFLEIPTQLMKREGFLYRAFGLEEVDYPQTEEFVLVCTKERDEYLERAVPSYIVEGKGLKEVKKPGYVLIYTELAERIYELRDECSVADAVYTIVKGE